MKHAETDAREAEDQTSDQLNHTCTHSTPYGRSRTPRACRAGTLMTVGPHDGLWLPGRAPVELEQAFALRANDLDAAGRGEPAGDGRWIGQCEPDLRDPGVVPPREACLAASFGHELSVTAWLHNKHR